MRAAAAVAAGPSPPFSLLLIAAVVFLGCAAAAASVDGDRPSLRPTFLNGHYIAWWPPRRRCGSIRVAGPERPHRVDGHCGHAEDETDGRPPPPPPSSVRYAPHNVLFTRMQVAGDRAFVVSPRYRPGVPFTLGHVSLTDCAPSAVGQRVETTCGRDPYGGVGGGGSFHPVSPYPSLRAHCQFTGDPATCDNERLVNVVDAHLGPDGVLWVLDVGAVDTLQRRTSVDGAPTKYNDPRVLGIDAATGDTVHKIILGSPLTAESDGTLARRLRTVVVEYEESTIGDGRGAQKENGGTRTRTEDGVYGGDRIADCQAQRAAARPVAVYVGDAGYASVSVWFVKERRGIRVTLPPSVSARRDDAVVYGDGDDDLGADGMHMALLDGPRTRGSRPLRHLYFTYGRHPGVFRIPVTVFRDRRSGTADRAELWLNVCGSGGGDDGGNRCVTNVGPKPAGRSGRPLVPVDSAYGFLWYFRDGTAASRGPDVLYSWDSRRPFSRENFEPVAGTVSSSPDDRDQNKKKKQKDDSMGGKGHDGHDDELDDDDDNDVDYDDDVEDGDRCPGCDAANRTTTAAAGRPRRLRSSPPCSNRLQVTSVHGVSLGAPPWTLRTNTRDWLRDRIGRFGATAVLCPVPVVASSRGSGH